MSTTRNASLAITTTTIIRGRRSLSEGLRLVVRTYRLTLLNPITFRLRVRLYIKNA
jgi:hypothetical protein